TLHIGSRNVRKTVKIAQRVKTKKPDSSSTAENAPAIKSGPAGEDGVKGRKAGNVSGQTRWVARLLHSIHGSPGARQRQLFIPQRPINVVTPTHATEKASNARAIHTICRTRACRCQESRTRKHQARNRDGLVSIEWWSGEWSMVGGGAY